MSPSASARRAVSAALAVAALSLAGAANAASPNLVISQVYGAGGNTGASHTHDYIEIFNRGALPVPLAGLSLQYASATGTGNFGANDTARTELPGISLEPGQYFLVREAPTSTTTNLPSADHIDLTPINMSGTGGKVALVTGTDTLACNGGSTACDPAAMARIIDLVGYGAGSTSAPNFFEGTAAAPAASGTTAVFRAAGGCTDTDDNAADFTAAAAAPRNSATTRNVCGAPPPDSAPTVTSTTPSNDATGVPVSSNITITFSEPVTVTGSWYDITCVTSGGDLTSGRSAAVTGGPTTYTLNPNSDFPSDAQCTVTVWHDLVTDQDGTPHNLAADVSWSFYTSPSDPAPSVASTTPTNGATNVPVNSNITITFSEPVSVTASGSWYQVWCRTGPGPAGEVVYPATVTGGPTTYTINPDTDLGAGLPCTVTVQATQVNDQDPPPQNMAENHSFSFTTAAPPIEINQVQAATHISPYLGQAVTLAPAIVTGVRSNGFFLQDPSPDSDPATSEAIFVFTVTAPVVRFGEETVPILPGDLLNVSGTVVEFRGGSASGPNLTLTQISTPSISMISSGNGPPAVTVIGTGGRMPPTTVIEDDSGTGNVETGNTFDPAADGIDFYESLEGMRVQINDAVVVGPTNNFGELWVLPDDGSWASLRTARGGIVVRDIGPEPPGDYRSGDFNPERIQLDDALADTPDANVNDRIPGATIGILNYDFGNYELFPTSPVSVVSGGLTREVTTAAGPRELSVATFNVENLDPRDPPSKFADLASLIVNNLRSPDVIGLEEVQDNNGSINDETTDGSLTLTTLAAAIVAAGGPSYDFREIDPVDDQDGGELGGNIRVAFLFRTDRGVQFVDRAGGGPTTDTGVVNGASGPELTASPGRVSPTNSAWNSSRKPLAGEFLFRGEKYFVIVNHFNSKGGDQPLFGRFQPPTRTTETQRLQQAQVLNDFVDQILAVDASANVIALGDFNDFEFSQPLQTLMGGVLFDLIETLPANERYGYVFDGNSQTLDHILVSANIMAKLSRIYDVVHVNAEFAAQTSDHDPSVVRIGDQSALSVTKDRSAGTVTRGGNVLFPIRVENDGPQAATNVTLVDPLPAGAELVGVHTSQGTCGGTTTITCALGTLPNGTAATIAIEVRLTQVGTVTNTASVTADQADANREDDQASASVQVVAANFLLTVTKAGAGQGTVTSSPAGINCGSDCDESYVEGTTVTLTATPASGSTFTGWSGACTGTGSCVVTMSQARSVTANFAQVFHTLTVTKAGTGQGTVTSGPTGINCGSDCSEAYVEGTPVTLTATPASGSTFTGWSGACTGTGSCVVTMSQARSVTATFTQIVHALTVTKAGTGEGTVTSTPAGINCGSDCSESYVEGTSVTLTAAASAGSNFTGWSGACTGTGSCVVTMSQARNVTATFALDQAGLSLTKTASTDAVSRGGVVSYTLRVTNQGPQGATGVTVVDPLPAGAQLLGVTSSQGTCTAGPPLSCALGAIANGASATVTIDVRATQEGTMTNVANVTGSPTDPNTANNSAMAVTTVGPPAVEPEPRDCRVRATPRSMVAGKRTTVRVTTELLGPREAQGDTLVRLRGPGIDSIARTGEQGSVSVTVRAARAGTLRITAPELGSCSTSIRVKAKPRSGTAGAGAGSGPGLTGRPN